MLHATRPLFSAPADRAPAEFALGCLARVRFLSEGSLMALAGPRGFRLEVLQDLTKAGLLYRGEVVTDALAAREVAYVALTLRGARVLEASTGMHAKGVSTARLRKTSQKRAHDLCVGETAAAFVALAEDRRIELRGVEVDDRKIGVSTVLTVLGRAPERVPLQPDSLVVVDTHTGPSALLIEVDMGTTSVARMARKYAAYVDWQRHHGPERDFSFKALRIVTLASSEQRAAQLHDAALRATHGQRSGFLVFGLIDDVNVCASERLLGPIVRQLGAPPNHRVPLLSRSSVVAKRTA